MTRIQPIIVTHFSSKYWVTAAVEQMIIHRTTVSTHLIHCTSTSLVHHTTLVLTLFSQMRETSSTGLSTSIRRRVLSCEAQSAHRYRGGGWSLHSDATVASMHIYNHHTPHRYRGGAWSLHSDATVASTHIYNHHTPHRYRGGAWSLHSDATVASTHIYNHHTPHRYRGGGWSLHSDATVASTHIYNCLLYTSPSPRD